MERPVGRDVSVHLSNRPVQTGHEVAMALMNEYVSAHRSQGRFDDKYALPKFFAKYGHRDCSRHQSKFDTTMVQGPLETKFAFESTAVISKSRQWKAAAQISSFGCLVDRRRTVTSERQVYRPYDLSNERQPQQSSHPPVTTNV